MGQNIVYSSGKYGISGFFVLAELSFSANDLVHGAGNGTAPSDHDRSFGTVRMRTSVSDRLQSTPLRAGPLKCSSCGATSPAERRELSGRLPARDCDSAARSSAVVDSGTAERAWGRATEGRKKLWRLAASGCREWSADLRARLACWLGGLYVDESVREPGAVAWAECEFGLVDLLGASCANAPAGS